MEDIFFFDGTGLMPNKQAFMDVKSLHRDIVSPELQGSHMGNVHKVFPLLGLNPPSQSAPISAVQQL